MQQAHSPQIDIGQILDEVEAVDHHPALGSLRRPWTIKVDQIIGWIVEPVGAALIAFTMLILAAGVFSRYVLHSALVWSDELAIICLVWIAFFGAAAAMRRGRQLRLTFVANRAGPARVKWFDSIGLIVVALFCLEMLFASYKIFILELNDLTPALSIPRSVEIAPIIISMVLMLILAVLRMIDSEDPKIILTVLATALLIAAVAYFGRSVFMGLGYINLVLWLVVFFGTMITIGTPIAFCFGASTLTYLALSTTIPLQVVLNRMGEGVSHPTLLALPLFCWLGVLMMNAGMAVRLVDWIASMVGHFRGGLHAALILAMFLVSGISGSKTADMAAVAPVLFPPMLRRGIKLGELVALLNGAVCMAETIPPALVLIIVGSLMGISIQALFIAGMMPAIIKGILLLILAVVRAQRDDRSELAERPELRRFLRATWFALPGLVLPFIIRSFVLNGVCTATEVATVAIVYTFFVGALVYRELDWKRVYHDLADTVVLTGSIMIILATATATAWALTQSGFAQLLSQLVEGAPGGANGFIAICLFLFLTLGMFLEGLPAIIVLGPLLFPVAKAFGIHEVTYAIVMILAMNIGTHMPPIGIGFYVACAIGKCSPDEAWKPCWPYLVPIAIGTIIVAYVPWFTTAFLPTFKH